MKSSSTYGNVRDSILCLLTLGCWRVNKNIYHHVDVKKRKENIIIF